MDALYLTAQNSATRDALAAAAQARGLDVAVYRTPADLLEGPAHAWRVTADLVPKPDNHEPDKTKGTRSVQPQTPVIDRRDDRRRDSMRTSPIGDLEAVAARILSRATGAQVILADDGSREAVPDLEVVYPDGRRGVGEVVADMDEDYAATARKAWRIRWSLPEIRQHWVLTVEPSCRIDDLEPVLGRVLPQIEHAGIGLESVWDVRAADNPAAEELEIAGVIDAYAFPSAPGEEGQVQLVPQGAEAAYERDWSAVTTWLNDLLRSAALADVLAKLGRSGAGERHAFVGVTYSSPGEVFYALDSDERGLPLQPDVPNEITDLWLLHAGTTFGRCLHWAVGVGWRDAAHEWEPE